MTLAQLRQRMPALQKQAQAVGSELQSLEMAAVDEAKYLQLAESLCPDLIEDRGHEFGTRLPDADKRALIEFLKTL